MLHLGLVVLVHGNASAAVRLEPRRGKIEVVHRALPADCVEQCVARDSFLAFQVGHHRSVRQLFHALHLFAQPQGHRPSRR